MKIRNDSELLKQHLELRQDFKIIYDGEDFGIYKYNQEKNVYQGLVGYLSIESMLLAIIDEEYFIKLEIV